jgi:uncharacterized short protein YbdD (DUF466 family)
MRPETRDRETVLPRFRRVFRQILGAPDYAAYLEHCKRAGHGPSRNEREYLAEFFERRGRIPRCC